MRLNAFVSLCLVMTLLWMQFYAKVRETFNGTSEYKAQIHHLREELKVTEMNSEMESEHFLEFRQYVATLMPDVLRQKGEGETGYPFRSLASTISKADSEKLRGTISKTLFEKGKEYYRDKKFAQANRAFKQIVDKFGYSPYVAEAYFLMAEGYYQMDEMEECTSVIHQMVELFPNHELTGFAMVRLGRIYEAQNRSEEAVDIYRTVLRSFPQRDVASQARASLRGMDQ